ncbi:MAG: hypothetical protein WBB48_06300 [Thermodesulfobacteriota bacterium]
MFKNRIPIFIGTFLIVSCLFFAIPEKGYSGVMPLGCCQLFEPVECSDVFTLGGMDECEISLVGEFFSDNMCDEASQECRRPTGPPPTSVPLATDVPTLGGLGLIAMAVVLGILGFIAIRRKKASA